MKKSNITFTEDIIAEVAKEQGLTEEEVMRVYTTNVKHIRKLMDEEEVCSIKVPYLGTMHINKGLLYKSMRLQEESRERGWQIDLEKYEKNVRKLEMIKQLDKERKEDGKAVSNHTKRTIRKMLKIKTGKTLDEIEDIQKEKNGENK